MKYYVYILRSQKDGNYYTGYTGDLKYRLNRHFDGTSAATRRRLPLELAAYKVFSDKSEAIRTELFIKKQRNKQFIENVVTEWKTGP
ncbi:MAG: GIY-YIG nuclease family protein [Endomicrobiales bacterium]|nr:GIY-YIG nuclease family protein [Endomicrobiales bacterium]